MLPGLFFSFWRSAEIITLIPTVGMLSWFVHGFVRNDELTPTFILVLFIVSVLALVWAIATLLFYGFTKHNAFFVAFIDLCFVGTFIAGVYELRDITGANCAHFAEGGNAIYLNLGPFGYGSGSVRFPYISFDKNCSMLKASFAFGIMNCIFFFFTFLIALWIRQKHGDYYHDNRRGSRDVTVVERRTSRRSGSRGYASSPRRSHQSRRSSQGRYQV